MEVVSIIIWSSYDANYTTNADQCKGIFIKSLHLRCLGYCSIFTIWSPGNMLFSRMSPNLPGQNLISTCSWCCSLCCMRTEPTHTPAQNNIAVYCHSHQYVHYKFSSTMYGAQLATMTPAAAWWSLWKHSVQFPLIVLLILSRTVTHFLYKSPQYCYIIKKLQHSGLSLSLSHLHDS